MSAFVLSLLLASTAAAVRPLTPPATEFTPGAAWINAKPLSMALLHGRKVTVVAFINPTSVNSIRALPILQAWFDRYALSQLMVIGVLSPDLEMHRDPVWARERLKRLGVEFPVMLDSDRRVWKGYSNEGWPAFYLVDHRGRVVYDHLGEGGYAEFEKELRSALGGLVDPDDLPAPVNAPEPTTALCGPSTPDVLLGARSKKAVLPLDKDLSRRVSMIIEARVGEVASRGRWNLERDGLRLDQANADQGNFLRVVYMGAQALAVLAPPPGQKKTARFFLKQDDLWLHEGNAGKDVQFDDDGRSFVPVETARLYDLVRDPDGRPHELYIIPERKDSGVYGLSFPDSCTVTNIP